MTPSPSVNPHPAHPRPWQRGLVLGLLAYMLLLGGSHLLWVAWDGHPPIWDRAIHLEKALRCARILGDAAWGEILSLSGYYPPLGHCAAGLLHRLFGPSLLVAMSFIQVILALVVFATYAIGVRLGSAPMGAAAGLLVGAYTEVFIESRAFMLDLPLTALVSLSILALLKSEGFASLGWSLVAGGLAGLGLLTKWTYPFFVLPVGLFVWVRSRNAPDRGRRRGHLLLSLGVTVIVALPWYLKHLFLPASLLKTAYVTGAEEGDPSMSSVAGWGYYLGGMSHQLGLPFVLLLAAGLFLAWRWRIRGLGVLLVWFLAPVVLLTLLQNKDYRFTMPLLPAVALLSTAWLGQLAPRIARGGVGALLLLVAVHGAYLGWGWPVPEWARSRMDRTLFFPSFPPLTVQWPIRDILNILARDRPPGSHPVTLSVVPDHPHFSRSNFRYYATLHGIPLRLAKAWSGPPLFIDYVVAKTGEQGPSHTTRRTRALMARIEEGDPTLTPLLQAIVERPLPDGSRATLYRVAPRPIEGGTAAAVLARLRNAGPQALAWAIREPQGLQLDVEPVSDAQTLIGRFRRLILRADAALVGDFRRKPTALRVRGLELALDDVQLNPHGLLARGEIELLHIERLTIRHAVVAEEELQRLLADGMRRVRSPGLSVRNGYLEIRGEVSDIQIQVNLRLDLQPEANGSLSVWVERVRLGSFPIPAGLVNAVLTFVNPVVRFGKQPVEIQTPHLTLKDGFIRVNSQ